MCFVCCQEKLALKKLQKPQGMPELSENMEVDAGFVKVGRSVSLEPEVTRDSISNDTAGSGGGSGGCDDESDKSETNSVSSEAHVHPSLPSSFLKKMGLLRSFSDETHNRSVVPVFVLVLVLVLVLVVLVLVFVYPCCV